MWRDDVDLRVLNVCLITFDRPGYGLSDHRPRRRVADAAYDVQAIADWFGYQEFGVIGRSGGAPHALACATLLPERVTRVVGLVGLAPLQDMGPTWFDGMEGINQWHYREARANQQRLERRVHEQVARMREEPDHLVRQIAGTAAAGDRAILANQRYRATLVAGFEEAARTSHGWMADILAFAKPWGFDPGRIKVPTLLLARRA